MIPTGHIGHMVLRIPAKLLKYTLTTNPYILHWQFIWKKPLEY